MPTLNLGKKKYVEKDFKQVAEKAQRAKKRRKQAIEAEEKRKRLNASGLQIIQINFNNIDEPCSSVSEASTEPIEDQAGGRQAETSTEIDDFSPNLEASVATEAKSDVFTEIVDQKIKTNNDASCRTDEFGYMCGQRGYATRDFFDSDDKVQFYTGLPSNEILMVVFEHVSPFVARKTVS